MQRDIYFFLWYFFKYEVQKFVCAHHGQKRQREQWQAAEVMAKNFSPSASATSQSKYFDCYITV